MVKTNTDKQVVDSSTSTSNSNSNSNSNSSENNNRFKGVRKRKWGKYVSEIRLPNSRERIWLGSYDTPEKAARAFDAALYCLRGKQAKFNFPDNPPDIQGGTSLKPQEIQVVAAKFANEHIVSSSSSSQLNEQEEHHLTNLVPSNYSSPPTNSEGTVDLMSIDWPSLDFSMMTGSESSTPDFGAFGGLDDFPGSFLPPEFDVFYDEDEYTGGDYSQSTSLWNFNF